MRLVIDNLDISLGTDSEQVVLSGLNEGKYKIMFNEYQAALGVPDDIVDGDGSIEILPVKDTESQKWKLEEAEGFYMICYQDFALTYDLETGSVNMTMKTGGDNQLWSFVLIED